MKALFLALCFLLLPRLVLAAPPISLSVDRAPVRDVLQTLASLSGQSIITDPELRQTVSLELHELPFEEALDLITQSSGLSCRREGKFYLVSTPERFKQRFGSLSLHPLEYIPAKETAETLRPLFTGPLSYDSVTNTLLFGGDPAQDRQLAKALETLDRPTRQITLEARILSLDEDASRELGLQWNWGPLPTKSTDQTEDSGSQKTYAGRIHLGHGYSTQFQAVLSALCQEGKAKILATPRIITLPGKEASIFIGDHIPVVTEKVTNSTTSTTTEYVDAGIRLSYTPILSQDGLITAQVHTEVSTPTLISKLKNYRITSRTADTHVRMREKETLVIGDLISEQEQRRLESVPLLSKLPLLGEFFKFRSRSKSKTEVCMLLTPYITEPGHSPSIYGPAEQEARAGHQPASSAPAALPQGEEPAAQP